MQNVDTLGFFFVAWGVLYILFAFVASQNSAVRSLFRVPFIFALLPERLVMPIGRLITGILFIAVGIFWVIRF